MKKGLLLGFLFLLLIQTFNAQSYSGKTFLAPRPVGVNIAMEYTTWHERLGTKKPHRHLQATGFYQESVNTRDVGRYFGIGNGSNSFQVGPQGSASAEVDGSYLIHEKASADAGTHPLAGRVVFKPKQDIWGVRFDYFNYDLPFPRVFFKANMAIARVTNNMHMSVCDSKKVTIASATPETSFSIEDFFAGRVNVDKAIDVNGTNLQAPLCYGKICGERSITGVADVDVALGFKALCSDKHHVLINIGATIPTGRTPSGRYLFEPMMGNGGHFALGAGLDTGFSLWENGNTVIKFLLGANYRFLFEGTERRTVGLKNCNFPFKQPPALTTDLKIPRPVKLLHYFLLAKDQQTDQQLFPAANVLTRKLNVEPGSQLDALAAFSCNYHNFVFDLGYNLFWKDKESVTLRSCIQDNTFGIAQNNYDTAGTFNSGSADEDLPVDNRLINLGDLDVNAATTPSQLTHKIFAGIGYACDVTKKYPMFAGIGGSYEFASNNAALETYALWAKLGISF